MDLMQIDLITLLTLNQEFESYPADHNKLDDADVVYHEMPGWKTSTINVKTFNDLPKEARDYVEVRRRLLHDGVDPIY
jgi:adenylosuccinate synthase